MPFIVFNTMQCVERPTSKQQVKVKQQVINKKIKKQPKPLEERITEKQFVDRLTCSDTRLVEIEEYEQKSDAWLDARKGRITASNFGAAVGHNKYQSPRGLLQQMLWRTFKGNKATEWGAKHEPVAFDFYSNYMLLQIINEDGNIPYDTIDCDPEDMLYPTQQMSHVNVVETGLVVRAPRYWMGNSPDGLVHVTYRDGCRETGLLEIKCPASKRLYPGNGIPKYYMDQIQGTMGNLGLPWCDFVVWTPTKTKIQRVPFCGKYWDEILLPKLTSFYFDMYVPAAVKKENGDLDEDMIE